MRSKKKAVDNRFVLVREGIYQCQECGYSKAFGEEQVHGAYHKSYDNCRKAYGAENVLAYKDLVNAKKQLETFSDSSELICDNKVAKDVLDLLYKVKYTTSLRLWDYSKPHPKFTDFIILLWNTPAFLLEVVNYISEDLYATYVEQNRANRAISGGSLICHRVEETTYARQEGVRDIRHVDSIVINEFIEDTDIVEECIVEMDSEEEYDNSDIITTFQSLFSSTRTSASLA